MELDYRLKTKEERTECVRKLLSKLPQEKITPALLEYASDYILFVRDKGQTHKEKQEEYPTPTKNREVTINKRQTSLEGIVSNLENGEDGLYALIANDTGQLLDHKKKIDEEDYENHPALKEKKAVIDMLTEKFKTAKGKQKYFIKKQIIETWQEMYMIRSGLKGNIATGRSSNQIKTFATMRFPEDITVDENGMPHSNCMIDFMNPIHISFMLCHYSQLKMQVDDQIDSDMYWMLQDLEKLADKALAEEPVLYDLLIWKIDGLSNEEIKEKMVIEHGIYHNEQYYSTLWRKRIPKLLSECHKKNTLIWYYSNVAYGEWKQCSRCGTWKPANPLFFSKNSSKDGWYSICKDCRKSNKSKSK